MRGRKQKTKALLYAPALSQRARAEGTTLGRREALVWGGGGSQPPRERQELSTAAAPAPGRSQ